MLKNPTKVQPLENHLVYSIGFCGKPRTLLIMSQRTACTLTGIIIDHEEELYITDNRLAINPLVCYHLVCYHLVKFYRPDANLYKRVWMQFNVMPME
jgi:hypothetical protein